MKFLVSLFEVQLGCAYERKQIATIDVGSTLHLADGLALTNQVQSSQMNILRLVAAEREKKNRPPNENFAKLEKQAACNRRERGECPIKMDKAELKEKLTPVQYRVTQERGTERPFSGRYLHQKEEGVYCCVVCDNVLFHSQQKFPSGCGWPAFSDVIAQGKVTVTDDTSHCLRRVEACCSQCGAHLGHVFDDGPRPSQVRYCVNSASLDFKKHTTL